VTLACIYPCPVPALTSERCVRSGAWWTECLDSGINLDKLRRQKMVMAAGRDCLFSRTLQFSHVLHADTFLTINSRFLSKQEVLLGIA